MTTDGHGSPSSSKEQESIPMTDVKEYSPTLPFHTLTASILEKLFKIETDKGLSLTEEQLNAELTKFGFNELTGNSKVSWVKILIGQLANAMTLVLVVATVLKYNSSIYF